MQHVRVFRELLDHCSEGLRFYLGMSEVVKKAKQEAADFAFTRQVSKGQWTHLGTQGKLLHPVWRVPSLRHAAAVIGRAARRPTVCRSS